MAIGSVLVSRIARSNALASSAFSQASAQLKTSYGSPFLSQRWGSVVRAFSLRPAGAYVSGIDAGTTNSSASAMEGKVKATEDRLPLQRLRSRFQEAAENAKVELSYASPGERNFPFIIDDALREDGRYSRKESADFVHVLLKKNKTFVTVTDSSGNKKTGASAGSLDERKGRSRLSRYAAEATAEHVGRSARKMGLKSVVMKVKGSTFFKRKSKVILSWREGFRGEGVEGQSPILYIHDVTQLPHNGCRLPKKCRK